MKNIILLFSVLFMAISVRGAEKEQIPVVFYLQNMPAERIGTETDQTIMDDLKSQNFIVIPIDCSTYTQTSPEFERELLAFHENSPTLLASYETALSEPDLSNIYYVPEGYTLKKNITIWNIKDHGTDASLEYIMDVWNNEMVDMYGVAPVSKPEDMTDKNGNPLDLNMRMDLIYPTGDASKKVPLLIHLATASPRLIYTKPSSSTSISVLPFGFLSTGYAWAIVDYCFNPLSRSEVWPKFLNRSSLDDYDGLALYTAYIRYLKLHAAQYNLNGKIGLMGISKAAYGATRLANKKNAEQAEHLPPFNGGAPNTKPQPWQGAESTVDVVYSAAGNGTRRVPQYVDENTVPMITSAGYSDKYGHWNLYPRVVKHFQDNDYIHLPFWMYELGHNFPTWGTDYLTGIDRYVLFKKYFDNYLKTSAADPLEIFYVLPKENSQEVDQKGFDKLIPEEDKLPPSMLGIIPYEGITVRFLTAIDTVGVTSQLKVYNKASGNIVAGNWRTKMENTCLVFEPEEDLAVNEMYVLEVQKGIKAVNGQELQADFSREFTVSLYRESVLPGNKYASHEGQRLFDDITAGTYEVYELTTSGGDYSISISGISLTSPSRSFTLKAADGLDEKPRISLSRASTSTTTYMFYPSDTITATFEGIEFNGENQATTENKGYPNFCRISSGRENTKIVIKDCYFHSFSNTVGIFRIDAAGTSVDIQNSIFKENNTHIINYQTASLKYGDTYIKNSTFADNSGTGSLIAFANRSSGNDVVIDHITVDKFNTTTNLFKLTTLDGSFRLKNSIFTDINAGFNYPELSNISIDACYLEGFATPPAGTNSFTAAPSYANINHMHYGLTNKDLFICDDLLPAGNTVYYLDTPKALAATDVTTDSFTANWHSVENARGYEISLYQGSSLVEQQACESNVFSCVFSDLTDGVTYNYNVIAKHNGFGFDSAPSNLITLTTDISVGMEQEQEYAENDIRVQGRNILLPQAGLLEIYNLQGMLLFRQNNVESYVSDLPTGLYIIRFTSNDSIKISKKAILK